MDCGWAQFAKLTLEVFPEAVAEFCAKFIGHAAGGAFHFLNELVKIAAGTGDRDDAEGGGTPGYGLVHFGDGDVESLAELVFHRADYVTAFLERVGVLDAELESEMGYGHIVARPRAMAREGIPWA